MSGKIFDNRGFLNAEGEKATAKLKQEISKLLIGSDTDIQVIGCLLHKIVGDMVCDSIQNKKNEVSKFAAMSDEEFDAYLKNKYGPKWFLSSSLTEEELTRQFECIKHRMKKAAEDFKNNHPKVNRGWTPPRGRGRYID